VTGFESASHTNAGGLRLASRPSGSVHFDDLPPMSNDLVVLARAPRLGAVKTRLAAALGDARALTVYRELAAHVLAAVREATVDAIVIAFTPSDAGPEMRAWLGDDLAYVEQCDGDVGARMNDAIEQRFAAGARRVVVIGADCPTIDADTVRQALSVLETHDVVFGPATDGGYYLVAMNAPHPEIFASVPWSTRRTLATSLERARDAGLRVALLEEMRDVDTAEDWLWHVAHTEG
jgi:rSAM/selenodomain-associated transferase 1